jgi:homogentisate 1,2-dioxygenase
MTGPVLIIPKTEPNTAFQFTGADSVTPIRDWLDTALSGANQRGAIAVTWVTAVPELFDADGMLVQVADVEHLAIFTTAGRLRASLNDWIVLDKVTAFKVVPPGVFDQTYEILGDSE